MGLLIAGITGGASLIDNARITSLKREADDHIRDLFTFYARVGRFPGDLNGTGRIGYNTGQDCPAHSFPSLYDKNSAINRVSCPFVELYLYEISSFRPDPSSDSLTAASISSDTGVINLANDNGVPFSKIYKHYFAYTHYYTDPGATANYLQGLYDKISMLIITTSEKSVDVVKKLDLKFDDGKYDNGNVRAYRRNDSGGGGGSTEYINAKICPVILFSFDLK
jgi:hypothetical protein